MPEPVAAGAATSDEGFAIGKSGTCRHWVAGGRHSIGDRFCATQTGASRGARAVVTARPIASAIPMAAKRPSVVRQRSDDMGLPCPPKEPIFAAHFAMRRNPAVNLIGLHDKSM